METIDVKGLRDSQASGTLIDVRELDEYRAGHIPGAKHVPLSSIPSQVDALRDCAEPLFVICHSGQRSMLAANYLEECGLSAINVEGGMQAWLTAGFPAE